MTGSTKMYNILGGKKKGGGGGLVVEIYGFSMCKSQGQHGIEYGPLEI